jgi:hypothetical protein
MIRMCDECRLVSWWEKEPELEADSLSLSISVLLPKTGVPDIFSRLFFSIEADVRTVPQ